MYQSRRLHMDIFCLQNNSWASWDKCNVLKTTINDITVNNIVPFAGGASSILGTCGTFSSGAGFLGTSGTSENYNNIK